ncbi:O-antigen ligase family protein [Fenollaria sporofastidiosus]|uniref:O-antigen ligase family protein n=1 Tax=Fenollaria sporofastidiosus TaxID=2811778 RepID=UPI001C0060E4|nr:O-antigen ligase family protein [Fenollaria sporofastidiosus]
MKAIIENYKIKNNLLYPVLAAAAFLAAYKFVSTKIALALVLLLISLPFFAKRKFLMLNLFILGYNFLPDIVSIAGALAILAMYLVDVYIYKKESLRINSSFVAVALGVIMIIIGTVTSVKPLGSMRDLAMNFAGLAIFLSVNIAVKNKDDYNKIATSLAINAALICLWGIVQYKFFGTVRREWLDSQVAGQISKRAYSVFMNPNVFAEYIVLVVPIVVSLFWAHKDAFKKFVYLCIVGLMLLSLMLTFSRGGIMSLGVAALVFLFFQARPLIVVALPFFLLALSFLPENIKRRIMSISNVKDSSTSYRFKIWSITKDVIKDHPVVGVGFGHKPFKYVFERYIRSMPIFHAHNTYLEMMAEGGFTGFISFVLIIITAIAQEIKLIYKAKSSEVKTFAAGLLAATLGILTHAMFEHIVYIYRIIVVLWLVLGLVSALKNINVDEQKLDNI